MTKRKECHPLSDVRSHAFADEPTVVRDIANVRWSLHACERCGARAWRGKVTGPVPLDRLPPLFSVLVHEPL